MAEKLPWFKFFPGDWIKDGDLSRCSKAAKGVWIDMICLLFDCEERGVFATGGIPWSDEDISAAIGGDISENLTCVTELLRKGVAHRNKSGAIFSRRLVRDEKKRQELSEKRSESGKKGGRPSLKNKGSTDENDEKSKPKANRKQTGKQNKSPSEVRSQKSDPSEKKNKQKEKFRPEDFPVPPDLDTEEFREAWREWCEYRKDVRKRPVSETAAHRQMKKLANVGSQHAVSTIEKSIENDWTGLFPEKVNPNGSQTQSELDRAIADAEAEERNAQNTDGPGGLLPEPPE